MNSTVKETVEGDLANSKCHMEWSRFFPGRFSSSLSIGPNAIRSRYRSSGRLTVWKTERTTTFRTRSGIFIFLSHFEGPRNQSEHISEKSSVHYRPVHWHAVPVLIKQILAEQNRRRYSAKGRTQKMSRCGLIFEMSDGFHGTTRFSRNYAVFAELHGFHGTTRFSRNYAVFTELHGFRRTTQFSRKYAVFAKLHGFHEITRFSRNYTVFT